MKARPFQLVTAGRLAQAREGMARALADWQNDWHPGAAAPAALTLAPRAAAVDTAPGWLAGDAEGAFVWVPRAGTEPIAAWLFDDTAARSSEIAGAVALDALRGLLTALLGPAGDTVTSLGEGMLPARASLPGEPVIDLGLSFNGQPWHAVMRLPDVPAKPATKAAPVDPLPHGLRAQTVSLSADLGEVDIDLRTLNGLALGDVIRFDTRLDQALRLRVNGKPLTAGPQAHVGMLGGHRALEIVNPRKTP